MRCIFILGLIQMRGSVLNSVFNLKIEKRRFYDVIPIPFSGRVSESCYHHSMNKVRGMDDALAPICDGMRVMVAGFMTVGTPLGLIEALTTRGPRHLTVVCSDAGTPGKGAGMLVDANMVDTFIGSHVGLNPRIGERMAAETMNVHLVPQGTLAERIRCAGAGLGGFFTPTGAGTEWAEGKECRTINGKSYVFENPLPGDVALIRAHRADASGNCIFRKSARNFNPLMAMACQYVVVEADIVEEHPLDPDQVMLPGVFVDAVVHRKEMAHGC